MARIRTIKPEFWDDEAIGAVSRDARLLFISTWNHADDEGLLRWTPEYIKASTFPYDDDLTVGDVEKLMEWLTEIGVVFPYRAGKAQQRCAYVVNFKKHQRINRPSPGKLSPPSLQSPAVAVMYAERDNWTCHICRGEITNPPTTDERWNLSLDHVTPRAAGGTDYPSNIAASHLKCNKSKGARSIPINSVSDSRSDSVSDSLPHSPTEGKGRERDSWEGSNPNPRASAREYVPDYEIDKGSEEQKPAPKPTGIYALPKAWCNEHGCPNDRDCTGCLQDYGDVAHYAKLRLKNGPST